MLACQLWRDIESNKIELPNCFENYSSLYRQDFNRYVTSAQLERTGSGVSIISSAPSVMTGVDRTSLTESTHEAHHHYLQILKQQDMRPADDR